MKERSGRRIMGIFRGILSRVASMVFLLCVCVFIVPAQGNESGQVNFKIIAHPSVSIEQLNMFQLRKIFSMKQTNWPDGQAVSVFVLDSKHPNHLSFCKSQLKMFPYQLEQIWNKLTYSSLGDPPVKVDNMEQMLKKVSQTPGAIGYLHSDMDVSGVNVITVSKG